MNNTVSMTPVALSLLGFDPASQRRILQAQAEAEAIVPEDIQNVPELRPVRPSRTKATSYFNSFQTVCSTAKDDPPSYDFASRQRLPQRPTIDRTERLPAYSCTVQKTMKVLLQLESESPLHDPTENDWKEAYVVLCGTLLSFHATKDSKPGKLLRSYTLQHAEVGLATDTQHTVLVPQTRLARLIPSGARRKAWQKDPDLFMPVRQHILRLRVESDQIILADSSEEQIHALIHAICAGIDVAHSIDERSVPRQCTVPRRRRRPRNSQIGDVSDPILIAEQERILRDMYPGFAEPTDSAPTIEQLRPSTIEASNLPVRTPTREEDEVDLAAIREDIGTADEPSRRPPMTRNTTASSVNSAYSADMMYATLPANFTEEGKWQPPHTRTAQQIQRYVRRCMPVLLAEAVRASDVLIVQGKRVKINWRMELLEEWELQPPSYKSHHFDNEDDLGLVRTSSSCSQHSTSGTAPQHTAQSSNEDLPSGNEDQITITRAETQLAHLDLSKSAVVSTLDKSLPHTPKPQPQRYPGSNDVHGVVFCF
jgi:hypothetical protein